MAKKLGKRYKELLEKVDSEKFYTIKEASALLKDLKSTKFDESPNTSS